MEFDNTIKKNKIEVNIDLSDEFDDASVADKKVMKEQIKLLVKANILDDMDAGKSSVTNRPWKQLSKKYKALKKKAGKGGRANLQLTDDMVDNLKLTFNNDVLRIKISNSLDKKKAHNHIKGVTKGMPKRKFLPDEGQKFRKGILDDIRGVIKDGS